VVSPLCKANLPESASALAREEAMMNRYHSALIGQMRRAIGYVMQTRCQQAVGRWLVNLFDAHNQHLRSRGWHSGVQYGQACMSLVSPYMVIIYELTPCLLPIGVYELSGCDYGSFGQRGPWCDGYVEG